MTSFTNPFFFESPSNRWSFTDREALTDQLLQLMTEQGRRLLIFGRRRMGKTSLIKNAAEKAKITFIYCDISTAANMSEVARKLMDEAPKEEGGRLSKALEIAGKYLKSVGVSASKITITGELRPDDGNKTLESVLNVLNERAAENDEVWTVCLDEFQEIRALGGPRVDWQLRGIMQEHRNLNYLFTGSDHRIVNWMTDPTAPFFKQLQQMEVGPITGDHIARWIEKRAKIGGLSNFPYGDQIVAIAGPCTGDIVRLAKAVFSLAIGKAPKEIIASAFDSIGLVELHAEFLNHWHALSINQRGVLRAIADGKQPTSAETLREYGLRATSTASTAVEALVDRQFLVRTNAGMIFDNPFFRRWVQFNGQPRER
ncbi:MAG TPA: ATP-binding protein [Acidobacteriaceae bacterium]